MENQKVENRKQKNGKPSFLASPILNLEWQLKINRCASGLESQIWPGRPEALRLSSNS